MNLKQLNKLLCLARENFINTPSSLRIDGLSRGLEQRELVALSYYKAVITLLVSEGELKDDPEYDIKYIEVDSEPETDDYT
jgi:hypothetical protein